MESFTNVLKTLEVPSEVSDQWLENIRKQYSEEKRYFHNVQMLENKLELIEEVAKDVPFKNVLILATYFQYFHYDVKRDLKKENCDEFRKFIDQAGIKDVS